MLLGALVASLAGSAQACRERVSQGGLRARLRRAGAPDPRSRRAEDGLRRRAARPRHSRARSGAEPCSSTSATRSPSAESRASSASRSIPATRATGGSTSRTRRLWPQHGRPVPVGRSEAPSRRAARSCSPFRTRTGTTTAGISRSGRTACCTRASATAAPEAIPRTGRRTCSSQFGKLLALDSRRPAAGWSIAALGLRNPWRFSFDRANGDLYIGDVGQGSIEEVNFTPRASPGLENYGWDLYEGSRRFEDGSPSTGKLVFPVAEYDHGRGCSVTGGYVYRGAARAARARPVRLRRLLQRDVWSFRISEACCEGTSGSSPSVWRA